MQQAQFYFNRLAGLFLVLLGAGPVHAATMAQPHKPDPLLDGGPTSACAESPDYAAGTDVNGHAVPLADEGSGPVPLPDTIAVPLHAGQPRKGGQARTAVTPDSTYVGIDGKRLDPLVNPKPCR
jgi:hypothetical protein